MRDLTLTFYELGLQIVSLVAAMPPRPNRGKAVALTSARRDEGVTTIAEAVALYAASMGGHRILLVDASLERPRLHERLRIPNENGFSDHLATGTWHRATFVPTAHPNLTFLPAGKARLAGLLYAQIPITNFLNYATSRYDIVLLDTPSVGATGANRLLVQSDGIILVVDASRTRREVVQTTIKNLNVERERILGVVLNKKKYALPQVLYERV